VEKVYTTLTGAKKCNDQYHNKLETF